MIYIGKFADTQTQLFVDNEFVNFESAYPDVDFFAVDLFEIDSIQDQIESNRIVIYYADTLPYNGLDTFFKLFNSCPNKTFYMLTDSPAWEKIADWPSNAQWVWYNPVWLSYNPHDSLGNYREISCLTDKNFDSTTIGISLNRLPRTHRLCALSYMLGIGLDQDCIITAPLLAWHLSQTNNNLDIMDVISWDFSEYNNFKTSMLKGWERAKKSDGIFPVTSDAYPPYDVLEPNQTLFDNPSNYSNNLAPLYKNSMVEFVNSSVYDYRLPWICEKILNSQLGCNFPIFVAGEGTVDWLRKQGFDVFDDIVNHGYDVESNPVLRIQKLINDNRLLLVNTDRTKDLWIKNKHRFQYNVSWYSQMHDKVLPRGRKQLNNWLIPEG